MADTKRAAHLLERYGERAVQAYRDRVDEEIDAETLVSALLAADPTSNGAYSTWIVTVFIKNGFLFDDLLSKVADTLRLFDTNKRRLPRDKRDIGSYPSLPDLWDVVKPFDEGEDGAEGSTDLKGRELRRAERRKARDESVIVVDDEQWTVAIPLTVEASRWWGRGTRWCTAARTCNAFAEYHRNAPLIVIDIKGFGKFQLTVGKYIQFMDSEDRPVKPETVRAAWSYFRPIILSQVRRNPKVVLLALPAQDTSFYQQAVSLARAALQHTPADFETYENIRPLLEKDFQIIHEVRSEALRQLLARDICSRHPEVLWWVPFGDADKSVWLRGIEADGKLVTKVPEEERTPEMCLAAMRGFGEGIDLVPRAMRTEETIMAAIESSVGTALAKIAIEEQSDAACLRAVQLDGLLVRHVAFKYLTDEIMQAAVANNPQALSLIPDFKHTAALCAAAIDGDGSALCWAAPALRTAELCAAAVGKNALALHHVPEELKTLELCRDAVAANTLALEAVPSAYYGQFTFTFDDPADIWRSASLASMKTSEPPKRHWSDETATLLAEMRSHIQRQWSRTSP